MLGIGPPTAHADQLHEFYRSPRATAMGGAFVAVADDESSIFLNPAGLAGVEKLSAKYLAVDIEVSTDLIAEGATGAAAFGNISGDTLNKFMGKNIFAHAQIAPTLVMPKIGFALISDHQFSLTEQNQAYPQIMLGYQSTNGIQAAYGMSLLGRRAKKSDLRVGVAAKLLWRRGGYHTLGFLDIIKLTESPTGTLAEITGDYGMGYGGDLGVQYLYHAGKKFTLSAGASFSDIGDTSFASIANPIRSNLSVGVGAVLKLPRATVTAAFDQRHLLAGGDFRRRNHLGIEFKIPMVTLAAGMYQTSFTYGGSFDFWIFRISGAAYGEEKGTNAGQNIERRYDIQTALKFGF